MPPKRRHIRLTFIATGESVVAELLDDEAPATCDLVWDLLPVEHDLFHGRWSGTEVFVVLDEAPEAPAERRCHLPLPGEILLLARRGQGRDQQRRSGGRNRDGVRGAACSSVAPRACPASPTCSPGCRATGSTTGWRSPRPAGGCEPTASPRYGSSGSRGRALTWTGAASLAAHPSCRGADCCRRQAQRRA